MHKIEARWASTDAELCPQLGDLRTCLACVVFVSQASYLPSLRGDAGGLAKELLLGLRSSSALRWFPSYPFSRLPFQLLAGEALE